MTLANQRDPADDAASRAPVMPGESPEFHGANRGIKRPLTSRAG
jgi:hypothetical protein